MAKKKDAPPGSTEASVLRRSGRETSSRKQTTSSPVNSRKSERAEKHKSPSPSPVKSKLEKTEKQMGPSPLRRSDRGKKLVEIPDLPDIKSTKENTANNSKQSSDDVKEDKKTEKQDPDVGGRKRKRFTATRYKALFKPQRIRIEPDDDKNREVEDKSPQANTSRNEDVDKELKTQNSITVQGAPDKDCKTVLERRVIDLDRIEHGDCPQTKSLDGKSSEGGEMEKKIGGNVSPSNGNIANSYNHMVPTSSYRIEPDLENQQEPDTCDKVTGTCKTAGFVENAENNDVSSNMQNSRYVEFWVPVQISNVQLEQYCATLLSNAMALRSSSKSDTLGALKDVIVTNRKCCNHPYIVDPKLQHSLPKDKERSTLLDVGIKASGKLQFLDHVLPEIQKHQLKVLILFQPTSGTLNSEYPALGEILIDYVCQRYGENSFVHVDGVGNISSKKQAAKFNKEMSRFIFLLESRSCHPSIKLSSVDVIIIFDSELNLSNDLKSLQKISIDSQSEQIMIFRLYSSSTLEEKVLKLAENNAVIDIWSQSLRSNCDALLTWGASDLFDKLTKIHSQTVLNISSEESLLEDVVEEFSYIISHKCKRNNTKSKANIIQVQNCGVYGKSIPSHVEIKTHLLEGDQPFIFWRKLLDGRFPVWKFVSELTPRQRKRPSYFLGSPPKGKNGVDGGGVKTRRRTINSNSTIKPAQLKTVTEGETGGVNEGDSAANNESQSSSGDGFWSTAVNNETSLLDLLKPTVSELCNILKFSEDVKIIVKTFLEFVFENYQVGKEHTSTLQAFMISLCWIGSSLGKSKINRSESFALAKKHFNFCCMEEEAETVYKKLKAVKEPFLQFTQSLDCLKDSIPASEGAKLEIKKSQHIPNVDAFENHESHENVSIKGKEEFEKIKREWDEKRVNLENEYKDDKLVIYALYSNPSIRFEKLKVSEREFAKKLEEHKRLWEIHLKGLKATMLETKRQVSAENEFSLHGSQHETQAVHSGNPETAPTLPENSIEAQSHDEPVCQGANDIESTGSHTSVKEMTDATVSSEQIGEVPAQQLDDDMEVDVAEKVESIHENVTGGTSSPDASHAVEDHNETGANDMVPHADSGDMEMPAGNYNKENDEDGTVGLDTSHIIEDRRIAVDDEAPEVECAEMGTPAGIHAVEDPVEAHNETDANNMAPHVDSGAVNYNKENNEDVTLGLTSHVVEDCRETVDDVAQEVECAEMGTPAGTCDKENTEDGEITPDVGDNHNETSPNDVLPRVQSAEMGTPAGTCNKENAEDGEITPDDDDDHNETSPKDVLARVQSAEMGTPAGTCDKENAEDGEIIPDTSNAGDGHNETSPKDVLPRVESAEMATPAGTCNKENAEDGEIIPDTPNVGDDPNETSPKDVRVRSAEMVTPAGSEENVEDNIIRPDALHANEDHNGSCGYNSNNSVCASDHLEPTIPEIQNDPLQPEQLSDHGVQDEEIDIGNLQPSSASQLDQIIPDVETDFLSSTDPMVSENPSDTLPSSGPLLEPICQEPNLTMPQSGENLEENLAAAAAETPHEEHQPSLATSVAPTPPVNALNMFDNLTNRVSSQMPNQTDPLQAEVERLRTVKDNVAKFHEETKQRLDSECKKEIEEIVAQIKLKYEAKHVEADAAYNSKKMELETNIDKVIMNKKLAEAFRSKCQDLTPSGHTGIQQASQAGLMQQLRRLSVSPFMRHHHGASSSSPGQSSGNQQPPPSEPQPPLQQPQTRPRQPLQVVHQPAALFSSRPPPMVNQTTSSNPPTTSRPLPARPPPMVNQTTSSSPPTTSRPLPTRPPPIITQITPSTTPTTSRPRSVTPSSAPTTSRPPPGFNTINTSTLPNRSPPSIAQLDMSAANLRISTETRGQSPYIRPQVSSEPRGPAPHMRPLVSNEPRAPAPHMRPLVSNEPRAPAPHLRSLTPRNRPFITTPFVSPDIGTHRRMLPGQHVTSGPSQSPVIPPPSTSSPQSLTPLPSEPVIVPPPSEPCTVPPSPPSEQTPLLSSFDNLNGLVDNAPRWVNVVTPQPDIRSQTDRLSITDLVGEGTAQSSSACDLVYLSDDD